MLKRLSSVPGYEIRTPPFSFVLFIEFDQSKTSVQFLIILIEFRKSPQDKNEIFIRIYYLLNQP